jgi:hypothetical protein
MQLGIWWSSLASVRMGESLETKPRRGIPWVSVLGWIAGLISLELAATWLLWRLVQGRLFLVAMPWDAPASETELAEAAGSAKSYYWPAMIVIAVIWGLIAVCSEVFTRKRVRDRPEKRSSWLFYVCLTIFVIGTMADIATTFAFFHRDGVDQELHPGIRLVSYALGRSVGPIITKLIQFLGITLISFRWRFLATYLFTLAGSIYLAGAIYNLWISVS